MYGIKSVLAQVLGIRMDGLPIARRLRRPMDRMETIEETRAEDWAEGEDGRDGDLGWMTMWLHKLEEDARSVTASEEEEAVAKCALLRANTAQEKELAASALRKARTNSDDLENKIHNTYDDIPWPLCFSAASLLTRMRENIARRGSEIEPF